MKCALIAAATIAAVSTSAIAGGPTVVAEDPSPAAMPAPAPVTDWAGAYAGLQYGRTGANYADDSTAQYFDFSDGTAAGGLLGYNMQRGAIVYGAEIGYSSVSGSSLILGGGDDTLDSLMDLRVRLGYATGRTLIYGALGYSKAETVINGTSSVTLTGASFGVGLDALVTERVFLGLDYSRRELSGSDDLSIYNFDSTIDTVGLRLGLKF